MYIIILFFIYEQVEQGEPDPANPPKYSCVPDVAGDISPIISKILNISPLVAYDNVVTPQLVPDEIVTLPNNSLDKSPVHLTGMFIDVSTIADEYA